MITRIEIDFALPVELTAEEVRWINSFVQRIAKHRAWAWAHGSRISEGLQPWARGILGAGRGPGRSGTLGGPVTQCGAA